MRRLCQMCAEPLALTSANVSSHTSTLSVHVRTQQHHSNMISPVFPGVHAVKTWFFALKEFEDLWSSLAVVVDGGPIADRSRLGSTVVDLSVCGRYRIIRSGWWGTQPIKMLGLFVNVVCNLSLMVSLWCVAEVSLCGIWVMSFVTAAVVVLTHVSCSALSATLKILEDKYGLLEDSVGHWVGWRPADGSRMIFRCLSLSLLRWNVCQHWENADERSHGLVLCWRN